MFKHTLTSKKVLIVVGLIFFIGLIYLNSKLKSSQPSSTTPASPTPKPQIVSPNSQISQLKSQNFSFSSNLSLSFPASLPVYTSSQPPAPSLNILFQQLIQIYNLKQSPQSSDYYYSTDKSVVSFIDQKNSYVSYSINGDVKPGAYIGKSPPTIDSAIASAEKFLQSFSDYKNLKFQAGSASFFQIDKIGGEYKSVSRPADSNLISVSFSQTVAGYPYRYNSSLSSPVDIFVGQGGQIVRATFTSQPLPDLSQSTDSPLLDSQQILTALNSGLASVVYAPLYNFPPNTSTLPPTTITDIKIEYRYDPQISKVLPYFILTGQFTPNQKSNLPITIQLLLPAVSLPN